MAGLLLWDEVILMKCPERICKCHHMWQLVVQVVTSNPSRLDVIKSVPNQGSIYRAFFPYDTQRTQDIHVAAPLHLDTPPVKQQLLPLCRPLGYNSKHTPQL